MAYAPPALAPVTPLRPPAEPAVEARVDLPEMPESARTIRQAIARAWKAYRGDWRGQLPLKVDRGDPDDNVLVNRCAPIVDKGVSFLFGKAPLIEVKDVTGQKSGPKEAQQALDAALGGEDDFMTTFTMLAMNGGVAGHSFVKLCPAEQDFDGDTDYPRIVVQDPQNYWVVTDPDDVNCVLQYVCEYDAPDPRTGQTLTKRIVTERTDAHAPSWSICTYTRLRSSLGDNAAGVVAAGNSGASTSGWTKMAEEVWPHRWSPIHECMNLPNPNEFWGISDITPDIIHLNAVLNYVESNINKIGRLHGTPWAYAIGVDPAQVRQVDAGPGSVTAFIQPDAKPGAVQWSGDLANLMAFAANVRSDMDEQSRIPAVALGRVADMPKGNLSGIAIELFFQPAIEKTTLKRRLYGRLIVRLCEHILELCGFTGLKVTITWPDLLPADDAGTAQMALAAKQINMSDHYLCELLEVDYNEELGFRQQEAQQAMKAALRGQGPMPAPPTPTTPPNASSVSSGEPTGAQAGPPVNHPAAVAARAAATAAGAAMKQGA